MQKDIIEQSMNNLKILYILNTTAYQAGSTKSFMTLVEAVVRKGICVHVVVPDSKGVYNRLRELGVKLHIIRFKYNLYPNLGSLKNIFLFLPRIVARNIINIKAVKTMHKIFGSDKPDIIHTNVSVLKIGYSLAVKLKVSHIYHVREFCDSKSDLHYFPTRAYLLKQLNSDKSYSICITKLLQSVYNLQNNPRSVVIYNGLVGEDKHFKIRADKKRFFLFAGRIEHQKGLMDLVKAYADYVKVADGLPLPLIVAGAISDYKYYNHIKKLIIAEHLSHLVSFVGQVNEIEELMSKAWAIVIPSYFEGFGRCMTEAMYNHCIVIAKDTGGISEQFQNGFNYTNKPIGLSYKTHQLLVKCLIDTANMSLNYRKEYTDRAYKTVCHYYSNDNYVQSVIDFYNNITKNKFNM